VVVRGLLGRFETPRTRGRRRRKEDSAGLGKWQDFVEAFPALPETTVLVFLDGELQANNPFLRALPKQVDVREFKALAQAGVAGWAQRRAARYGASLEARAVAALAALVGNHLWTLDSELRKLAVHAGDHKITEDDVRSLVSLARDPSIFAMADAVVEGRSRDAAAHLQRLLAQGESPRGLLAMLERQYRLLLLTKELLEQRVRPPEIATRLGVHGFVAQRLLRQAPAYTIDRLRRAYRKLLDADLNVKRGIYDDGTALDLLLFELSALAATPRGGRPGYSRPPSAPGRPPPAPATPPSGTS
ncbi:MAG: DNA polymerase III subunit delta, partial [Dehalococcoidia bacterium]|nr:DNA polymerase III subunit delta [Dehalococcoidia bacterium]